MKLRTRLVLLTILLVLLPAIPAMWVTRHLVVQGLNLGLSAEIAAALEAGVRQTRAIYQRERADLGARVDEWIANGADPEAAPGALTLDGDPGTEPTTEQPIVPQAESTARRPEVAPTESTTQRPDSSRTESTTRRTDGWRTESTIGRPDRAQPPEPSPQEISVTRPLPRGGTVTVSSQLSEEWQADAATLAASLQMVRGLQAERNELANRFWLPFLAIYGLALLFALGAAAWIGRGISEPVMRLAEATREVTKGRWDVRVATNRQDEIGQLGTAFNRMVETLDAQSRQLVELEKMAGWREMARALAHEVKNPLTPIRLTVEEMGSRYRGNDPDYQKLLDECTRIVVKEVESLRNIVTRFREFSRPVELRWEPVDLNELVAEVGSLQRDMEVSLDLDPNVAPISGDPDRLRQALMNLARNAQEALASVTASPQLHLATRPDGDRVVVVVEDNGPGIAPEERSRVFEPYRSGKADGLGLGLTLVKGIVLAHGGLIDVTDSSLGGARFRIELPRTQE